MKLEPCPFCGSDDVGIDQSFVECYECAAMGPSGDPDDKMWDSAPRNIPATIETSEVGPMPWRLQIALAALCGALNAHEFHHALDYADRLIAAHKATEAI